MARFFHTGDLGDIVACMPAIRELGGGDLTVGFREGPYYGRESLEGARFEAIKTLLLAQDYIKSVQWGGFEPDMHDFSTFRTTPFKNYENLARWQARHLGCLIDYDPWIKVVAGQQTQGRPLFARSPRYHNRSFDWPGMIKAHQGAAFIGMPNEHAAFVSEFGFNIEFIQTKDLLELASLIAGATVLVCNQSCPFWIAAGLGAPVIQETCHGQCNSVIERANARYPVLPEGYRRLEY